MEIKLINENTITNENGEWRSLTGPKAIQALALRSLIVGLDFEISTGMRMTRGPSCMTLAKRKTGLRTNKREVLRARLVEMLNQCVSECAVITDGKMT